MGLFSSSKTYTSQNTTNQTNIDMDLEPLGEVLSSSNEQTAQTDKETASINLINAELEREQDKSFMKIFDGYLENTKNGLILVGIIGAVLYLKKNKRGGKK